MGSKSSCGQYNEQILWMGVTSIHAATLCNSLDDTLMASNVLKPFAIASKQPASTKNTMISLHVSLRKPLLQGSTLQACLNLRYKKLLSYSSLEAMHVKCMYVS